MSELNISTKFTLEDIRKIRDYNYELFKTMTWEEQKTYYTNSADRVSAEIERKRIEKRTQKTF